MQRSKINDKLNILKTIDRKIDKNEADYILQNQGGRQMLLDDFEGPKAMSFEESIIPQSTQKTKRLWK